jgi:hypothetical protein
MGRLKTPSLSSIAAASLAFSLAYSPMAMAQENEATPPVATAEETTQTVVTAAPDTQITNSYHLDPLLPIPLIAGMALLYAGVGVYPFRRRIGGAFLRAAAGATITVLMLNPEITTETREQLSTEVIVAVDRSASQKFGLRAEETAAAYGEVLASLSAIENLSVRTVEIDGRDAEGRLLDGTQIFSAVTDRLSDVPRDQLGAIFIITDGIIHDVPEIYAAADKDVPIHALVTGQQGEFDRRIELLETPQFGLPDTQQTISFQITDNGSFPANVASLVTVTVTANGEVIQTYEARTGVIVEMELPVGHIGENIYSLSVDTVDGELTDVNNTVSTTIEGVREDFNVFLLSGSPETSTRVLRDVLRSDPGTNLVHITILRPFHKPQNVPLREMALIPVPVHEILHERIDDFDLIVLDRVALDPNIISPFYVSNIVDFVENGGSLLVVNSDEFLHPDFSVGQSEDMSPILPVTSDNSRLEDGAFIPQVDGDGTRHPVTRSLSEDGGQAEWGRWLRRVTGTVSDDANVLLHGPNDEPLLVVQRVGEGRVASLMSDNFTLWSRGYDGGGPDAQLLQNIAHWLMAYPEFEEESLRLNISEDGTNLIVTRQSLSEEITDPVAITSPTGEEIQVTLEETAPGVYQGKIEIQELGFYRAEHSGVAAQTENGQTQNLSSFTSVGPADPVEFQDTISTTQRLTPLFEDRAGTVSRIALEAGQGVNIPRITLASANADFSDASTLAVRESQSFIVRDSEDRPFIPGWLGMTLALAMFGGAWYQEGGGQNPLRRRKNIAPKPTP